jgi:hypothetical protein
MEIILLIVAIAAFGLFWYSNRSMDSNSLPSLFTKKDLDAPPQRDAYSPPVVTTVQTEVKESEAPAKKVRKPRTPKASATKKAVTKKPMATKAAPAASKTRRTRSNKA